jgi:hypothetical protein
MPTSLEAALGGDAPDTTATGFAVAMGGWAHGSISTAGDADFIAVDLVAGQSYSFAMVGIGATPLHNSYLRLYASDGAVLWARMTTACPMAMPSCALQRLKPGAPICKPARWAA